MKTKTAATLLLLGVASLAAACAPASEDEDVGQASHAQQDGKTAVTVVTEPGALAYLEAHGFSFAERFAGVSADAHGDALALTPRYASLVSAIERDVLAAAAQYAQHGYRLPAFGDEAKTAREKVGSSYQDLNWTWLSSAAVRWELTGVVNRFDRRILPERASSCGEVRLVYRAAYDGPRESSRLPVTVVVVFRPPNAASGCRAVAGSWIYPRATAGEGEAFGEWLRGGPLAGLGAPISFELDALTDLWSRFVRERDGVGRHHQYTLRVFRPDGDGLAPEPLANTPDVTAIVGGPRYDEAKAQYVAAAASPARKAALLAWIRDNRVAIDRGHASLTPLDVEGEGRVELRALQVDSFSAMGLTRVVNRPYSRVFGDDLPAFKAGLGLASDSEAKALLRRLDTMTCSGCHVTRSVLGLHLVGEERDHALYRDHAAHAGDRDSIPTDRDRPANEPPFIVRLVANKMAVGISPHLRDERDRRAADLLEYLKSGGGVSMPPPDRGKKLAGTYGAPCWRGDANDPAFGFRAVPEYACGLGLHCAAVDDGEFGQCVPQYANAAGRVDLAMRSVGDPFEVHDYAANTSLASADPFRETGPVASRLACIGGGATGRDNGFPLGGICAPISDGRLIKDGASGCALGDGTRIGLGESAYIGANGRSRKDADRSGAARVVCGAAPYQDNVSRTWGRMSTAAMIWESCAAGLQIACDEDHPCRDEYVCMRTLPDPHAPDPKKGTCMPGYVLAQLEIDAHKVPGTKAPCLQQTGKAVTTCR